VKILYAIAFVLFPLAAPAQSLDSSLLATLCADDYFEDTSGQCRIIATHQITLESILEKYGVIITRDTDDEVAIFSPSDPEDVPVGSIEPRNEGPTVEYSILTDDKTVDGTIEQCTVPAQIVATESTLEKDENIFDAEEVAMTGPNAAHTAAGAIRPADENRTVE
jgi:hypothetical protein